MSLPALPSTTDIRSITERVNAIIKQLYNKMIPVGADNYVLTSDGTTLAWEALPAYPITNTGATTFLTGDVTLVTINTFVNGPNTGSIGASGQTWLIMAEGVLTLGGGGGQGTLRIHNGTADIRSANMNIANTSFGTIALSVVVVLSAATTFTLQAADNIGGSVSTLKATATNGAANKATSITAVRIA